LVGKRRTVPNPKCLIEDINFDFGTTFNLDYALLYVIEGLYGIRKQKNLESNLKEKILNKNNLIIIL
jgi:hypothetical protein